MTSAPVFAQGASNQVIGLNNDGVKALNSNNFQLAIQKFQAALQVDKTYKLARDNLAIAYNNYGLQLANSKPKEALKQFHQALYLNRTNSTTLSNVVGIIKMIGKNPNSYQDRVALGDEARLSADFAGAIIEYEAALQIKDDAKLRVKLGDVYRVKDEVDQAINQYKIAAGMGDSADVEVKLGQAYQAKKDIPNAIGAYGKAIAFKSDDPDVQDALVAGWEEALKENPTAPENHIGLGQAFQYRGDWGQAQSEYQTALRFARGGPQASTAQRLLSALPAAKKSADVTKHINKGVELQQQKLYDQAIQEYMAGLAADPNNVDALLDIGTAYQAKGDFQNAIGYYQKLKAIDPSNQGAAEGIKTAEGELKDKQITENYKKGGELFKAGQYDAAIQAFQAVLQANPSDAATHFSLGASYQAKKDPASLDAAIQEYRNAMNIDPKNAEYPKALQAALELKAQPLIDQAIAKHKAKDYVSAIDLYNQALAVTPKNAGLWYNIASAEYARQNYEAAKNAYKKALELDPQGQVNDLFLIASIDENYDRGADAVAGYRKYLQAAATGTYAQAAKDRLTALGKNIHDIVKIKSEAELAEAKAADDAYGAAVQLQQQKNFDAAIQKYQEAITHAPKNADFVYSMGTCYQQKGDYATAVKCYNQALAIDPNNKDAKQALPEALNLSVEPLIDEAVKKQTSGDLSGAIQMYQQATKQAPDNARLWSNFGTALQQTDQYQGARDAYSKGYTLDPKNEVNDLYLIAALDENFNQGAKAITEYLDYLKKAPAGSYAQAAKDRVKALQANPANVQHIATQGEIQTAKAAGDAYAEGVKLQQAQKFDEAIASYQKAVAANPKEPAYLYAIGTAYQAKNDIDNAVTFYKKAVDLAPNNKDFKNTYMAAKGLQSGPVMNKAVDEHKAGKYAEAIEDYKKAMAIDPNNANGYTNMAGAYQALGDFNNARASYQKAIDMDPKGEVDNIYFLALLDENDGSGAKAIQDYVKYIQASPKGTYRAQAEERIKALRANPSSVQKISTAAEQAQSGAAADAYNNGIKFQQDGKNDEAIAEYKKAIAANPDPSYYYALGTAYQAKNDFDSAIEQYKIAVSKAPKEPTYKQTLTQAMQAKAGPLVDSAIKKQTGNPPDLAGAIVDYESALKIADDASTHMNLGTAYQAQNNNGKALMNYQAAVRMDPKAAVDAYYYMGTVYEAMKQNPNAINAYRDYVRLAPSGGNAAACRERLKLISPTHK